ncbi:MAG: DUF1501 domain-containing protein [bacterium JZ-2024 1]
MKEARFYSRRELIRMGFGLVAGGMYAPAFLSRTLWAIQQARSPLRTEESNYGDQILIVVQLSGGNDGLNTIVPFASDEYRRARPTLGIPQADALKISEDFGLHPRMKAFQSLYEEALVSIVHGVGYPNPNRSHFRSMEIWHTARPDTKSISTGWLGRYFDNACPGCSPPNAAINFGASIPQALWAPQNKVIALTEPEKLGWQPLQEEPSSFNSEMEALQRLLRSGSIPSETMFIAHTTMDSMVSANQVSDALAKGRSTAPYPDTDFGNALQTTARLISGGLKTRVYYLSLTGFDTHANQSGRHDELLAEYSNGMRALMDDLKASGDAHRVLVLTFSEFGRRVSENASGGTDHGTANPVFLIGTRVKPGFAGRFPSLSQDALDPIGDPIHTTDFREIYATILETWLQTPSEAILSARFRPLPLLKS